MVNSTEAKKYDASDWVDDRIVKFLRLYWAKFISAIERYAIYFAQTAKRTHNTKQQQHDKKIHSHNYKIREKTTYMHAHNVQYKHIERILYYFGFMYT